MPDQWERPSKTQWNSPGPTADEREAGRHVDEALCARAEAARARDGRPNILFVFTDQQTIGAMSCSGNPYVNTPNMDRLAARGVRFTRSYCTGPVCGPARSSLLTGRMPHETGVVRNGRGIDPSIPQMGPIFREAGYQTLWCGKWHLPQSYVSTLDGIPGFDNIPQPAEVRDIHGLGDTVDFIHAENAEGLLRWELRKVGLPWLLCVSFHNPHDICYWSTRPPRPHPNLERYPPLPANFAADPDEPEYLKLGRTPGETHMEMPYALEWDEAQWRTYIAAYYHLTEQVDRAIGVVLDALEEGGWADDTLVIFTSDHGDGCAAHRWVAKSCLYEEVVAVPFIASFPGRVPEGRVDETHLISGLDVLPTMCDYTGIAPPPTQGLSLRPLLEGRRAPWRDYVVSEVAAIRDADQMVPRAGRMVCTVRYKYNAYSLGRCREELFDLQEDPGETRNLADDPALRPVVGAHRARLHEWVALTNDPFPEPL